MPRIPADDLERLKQTISLQRLAEARGIDLKRHGADLIGRCPFHDDKTPSLVITPAKNLWHCLGACQTGGTVIDWVMRAEGVSFRHAVELLQNDSLPLAASTALPPKQSTVKKLPTALARDVEDAKLLAQVIEFYQQTLLASPEALEYLSKRGIGSPEAITTFKLGFANRTLGYRLPEKNRIEGAAIRGQLQRIGVLRASGHEHFSGSIVIPVIAPSGEVTEVYGRKINDDLREGTVYHLYLPGPHRGVWNEAALAAGREVILCEALIDAITFWCAGFRNVTASYGVEGFTADHLAAFKQHGVERVLIAYDRDEAGERAAEKLAKKLLAEGLDCYRVLFPKGMDANEYALKVGPATKSLGVAIRSAQWLGKGKAKPITTTVSAITATVEASPAPSAPSEVRDVARERVSSSSLVAEEAAKDDNTTAAELAVLPAQVIPDAPAVLPQPSSQAVGGEQEHHFTFGDRRYRVRGLEKNLSLQSLKVNLLLTHNDLVHVDTLDLYSARARASFIAQAATELHLKEEVIKGDLGRLLLQCEALQEQALRAALEVKPTAIAINDAEREAALSLLKSPDLLDRLLADFEACGVVGERTNKLVGYLAAISRKLERPLAVLIQSSSAAGKSWLMEAVLAFVPQEERVKYSAMTGQSLFYMGETNLKHKILAIAEEEGAARAAYALKLLQSEGELTIASTGKDPATGNLITQEYRVEGPVMIFLTTTAIEIDEELLNRCLVLTVDEGREQTAAIHAVQRARRTLAGLHAQAERAALLALHRNAQRLLRPLAVVNPYADQLTFLDDRTRTRRDHEKYLTLIDAIALLHQYQREIKTATHRGEVIEYIEVRLTDIAQANALAHEVLGRSLDELPPQTRRLLSLIVALVERGCAEQSVKRCNYHFSRRTVREHTGFSDTQLRVHLDRLVAMEYVLVHRGGRGQSFEYELLYDGGGAAEPHLSGLLDIATIATSRGQDLRIAGSMRVQSGVIAGDTRPANRRAEAEKTSVPNHSVAREPKTHVSAGNTRSASYPQPLAAVR